MADWLDKTTADGFAERAGAIAEAEARGAGTGGVAARARDFTADVFGIARRRELLLSLTKIGASGPFSLMRPTEGFGKELGFVNAVVLGRAGRSETMAIFSSMPCPSDSRFGSGAFDRWLGVADAVSPCVGLGSRFAAGVCARDAGRLAFDGPANCFGKGAGFDLVMANDGN